MFLESRTERDLTKNSPVSNKLAIDNRACFVFNKDQKVFLRALEYYQGWASPINYFKE